MNIASTKRHPREGTAALPYAENLVSAAQAIFVTTTPPHAGGHSGPPLRREFGICSASDIRDNHGHHVRADTAVRPYAENLVSVAQAILVKTTHHIRADTAFRLIKHSNNRS